MFSNTFRNGPESLDTQADPKETRSKEVGDQYTRVVSFCSNKTTFMISVSDVAKPVVY